MLKFKTPSSLTSPIRITAQTIPGGEHELPVFPGECVHWPGINTLDLTISLFSAKSSKWINPMNDKQSLETQMMI